MGNMVLNMPFKPNFMAHYALPNNYPVAVIVGIGILHNFMDYVNVWIAMGTVCSHSVVPFSINYNVFRTEPPPSPALSWNWGLFCKDNWCLYTHSFLVCCGSIQWIKALVIGI